MVHLLKSFARDENGAVTIDWVVLTAAVVSLAIAAWTSIDDQTTALNDTTTNAISGQIY